MMFVANEKIHELAEGGIGRLLFKYSWPSLVAMTLNALYCVVDRAFIGHGCGVDAMAGMQLAMPVMMLFGAFGVFIGAGHSALLSIKLGEKDFSSCEKLLGELVAVKLVFFLVLSPLVYFNLEQVLFWCGAQKVTKEAIDAAREYLRIIIFSHIFSHLAFGLSAMHRAEGGAIRSMLSMVVGFLANLILDPLFIFGLGMGVAGAAWATNISMFLSCAWAFNYYLRGKTLVRFSLSRIGIYRQFIARTSAIGLAPFLQHLMSSIIIASLQLSFSRWMPDEASRTAEIVSVGVFSNSLILVFMPILGAQHGLQPIFGYNWGARKYRRVLETLVKGFAVTSVLSFAAFILQFVQPFPTYLAKMFISAENADILEIAVRDLRISNSMVWMISVNVVATTYFLSIGRSGVSVFLSMLRQGVILLPIVWFLPYFMRDKALAIWLSMPISDIICNLVTLVPLVFHVRFLYYAGCRRKLCYNTDYEKL